MIGMLLLVGTVVSVFLMHYKHVKDENGNWTPTKQKPHSIIGAIGLFIILLITNLRSCGKL